MAAIALTWSCGSEDCNCTVATEDRYTAMTDSLTANLEWPENLDIKVFAGADLVPSPSCLAVSASGAVFVGVDKMGSLGKEMGHGAVIKLVDCNGDGLLDTLTEFAHMDNPRGILALGDHVFVLHTRFSEETKKAANMDLVVYEDRDNDGVADGEPHPLITDISNPTYLAERGTDHATNGIQMGIDGWIYIAVGDFGFHNATDRNGTKLTMLGGGIVRVRPDGTEMEIYSHGLRNIYDVAIDPFMNIFTRDNTNDGGGWNIRFSHQIQSGEYGYPILFQHFTEEIIPALIDLGGGSGTGALYLNDERWPEEYNNTPLMADWGRSYLYRHPVAPDKATFTQREEKFIQLPQITDVDVDASGILYLSAWDGAGYSGSPDIGYVIRAVPKGFDREPFAGVQGLSERKLVALLKAKNAKTRLAAQYELLAKTDNEQAASSVWKLAKDASLDMESRVAALFTYAQLAGSDGIPQLVEAAADTTLQEFALRALADRKAWVKAVPLAPFLTGLQSPSPRVQAAAIIGLGRLGNKEAVNALLAFKVPSSFKAPALGTEGPHATPNAEIVIPHLAVKALVALDAKEECIQALNSANSDLALWAMRYMHDDRVVQALMAAYENTSDEAFKAKLINTLARIYHQEAPYDASWWWSTRPDTHGPYYKAIAWDATPTIRAFLLEQWKKDQHPDKDFFKALNTRYRLGIDQFGIIEIQAPKEDAPQVDLEKIKNKKGQVGESSIEDVMLALDKIKGDPKEGAALFVSQGCKTCHSIDRSEVMKGPFMGQIGSIMNRQQIAESILKPNASISQGFSTAQIQTKGGDAYVGFVTAESADKLTIRNIAGAATTIAKSDIAARQELEYSMMPEGLANALSYQELASLVAYLEAQK
ncbi:putative heme-binding domain-containing protein [Parapedobacter koreensis]|uniref:Putative heme-binding domain-containing protein n=2 Tax=Parapedobacter koreensis TaxID=332977 RepID=A0A1H7MJ35_9SPHI|nr:putative heme-binding domain-containing protein [Parapedobacter koreensis]